MRIAYLAVLRVFGWLALLARPDRAKDAKTLLLRHQVAMLQRQVKVPRPPWADAAVPAGLAPLLAGSQLGPPRPKRVPGAGRGPRGRRDLIRLLRGLCQTLRGSTQGMRRVAGVFARTVVGDGGRIVADGPTAAILHDDRLLEAHGLERP